MDQRARVRVSFVIPVRDDAPRLQRSLASITRAIDAADTSAEVIVVDNESMDGSSDVARSAGASVIVSPGRVSELRNLGAARAGGDILAFVDADHEIAPGWITSALAAFADAGVAAAGAPYSSPPGANWVQRRYDTLRSRSDRVEDVDWLGSGNLAIRRDVFVELQGFDTSLGTCEDVDLCNRVRAAGHRLVAAPGLASIHFGDPASLGALFFGELWRGRDNLRVTLRGPRTARHLRSLLVPLVDLACIVGAIAAAALREWTAAAAFLAAVVGFAFVRAVAMKRHGSDAGVVALGQSIVVAAVYDAARALSLVVGGSHRFRRSTEQGRAATAGSRS